MTLEEKIGQLMLLDSNVNYSKWIREGKMGAFLNATTDQIEEIKDLYQTSRLGIPLLQSVDAIHGHCFVDGSVVFPTPLALSCSWDTELLRQVGRITALEMRATGFHWNFSPNLDLARDPRWGRVNETFGEDPFLVGELGKSMITGMQEGSRVVACPKHFAAYGESIGGRDSVESEVSKRKLHQLFLPPFQKAVEAGALSIMSAYQAIDGVPCTVNRHLLDTLLIDWQFQGIVVTDYDNVTRLRREQYVVSTDYEATIMAFKRGNHSLMATPDAFEHLVTAVRNGRIQENEINQHCRRILKIKEQLGLFDSELRGDEEKLGIEEFRQIGLKAAEDSIVLLKNNGILPLHNVDAKIAVIGPNADNRVSQLGDWGIRNNFGKNNDEMEDDHATTITILDGIKGHFSDVRYHSGCDIRGDVEDIEGAVQIAKTQDVILAVIGDDLGLNGEIKDRATLDLTGFQLDLLRALKTTGKPIIAVVISGKPLLLEPVVGIVDAILQAFNPGIEGGNAVAKIIKGIVNPSGKLTTSFPRHVGQLPVYYNQIPGWHGNSNGTGSYIEMSAEPLFPFGFGLSYSSFSYSEFRVPSEVVIGNTVNIDIRVENTSDIGGIEIVQVYFNDLYSSVTTPAKNLVAFKRIYLEPREFKILNFQLSTDAFSFVDHSLQRIVEPGTIEIMVGGSSNDVLIDLIELMPQ
jgi:beta-glucosidase